MSRRRLIPGAVCALLLGLGVSALGAPTTASAVEPVDFGDPPITVVQRAALALAGLDPERLHGHLGRVRWAGAIPQLRFRVIRDVDRDGRTTVRFSDSRWLGDLAAVDTRGDGLRLQGEVAWSPGALLGGSDELSALKEMRAAAAARRALLDAVTAAYFARRRAVLDRLEAEDRAAALESERQVAHHTALLDGLTGGAFSQGADR